jgi:hypothetical protein
MIVFGGVEIPSNRTLLERNGVTHVMLNYWGLRKRGLPKTKPYMIGEHFYSDMKVWVDSGASKVDESEMTQREIEEYAADYEDFVALNYDRIEGWIEFDSQKWGLPRIQQNRAAFLNDPKLWVVWHESYGVPLLRRWAEEYQNIAIPGTAIDSSTNLAATIRPLKNTTDTQWMALSYAKPDNLRQIPFDMVSTLAYLSPMRRGETIVWDGQKLNRYPKKMKDQARRRYGRIVAQAGLDFDKFISDDTLEATRLAIWSYLQLEKSMDKGKDKPDLKVIKGGLPSLEEMLVDNSDDTLYSGLMDLDLGSSDNSAMEMRNKERAEVVQRDASEIAPMPVFGYKLKTIVETDDDGKDVLKEVPVVQSQMTSLRQCDTCFVAANCPAFKPANTCAFNLPVEVKTKEQLKGLLTAIIEMQGQRVAFMRFAEEMNGGYADPNVSQEVDRLFKLVKSLKELEENKEFIRITAERQTSGGVLSAIFGDRASALREMQSPLSEGQTTQIIHSSIED